ncbi:MAG: PAS domain S-box protein [Gemmatimonadaceae bacterium]|nr:PAS domain S-box protein [Gemmatimonadaceae bacterium]
MSPRATTVTVSAPSDRLTRLQSAFHSAPELQLFIDARGHVLDANHAALAVLALPLDALLARALGDVPGWQQLPGLAAWLRESLDGVHRTHEVVLLDGNAPRRLLFTCWAVPSTSPAVYRVLGAEQAHEREGAATATALEMLRVAEAQFRAALAAGFDAFVIADPVRDDRGVLVDLRVREANHLAAVQAEQPRETLRGQSLLEVFPHSRNTELWEQCVAVLETQQPVDVTQAVPLPWYPHRWVHRQILPFGSAVAISSRDVTDALAERRALEESERRYRQLFASSAAMQLIVDEASGDVLDANAAAVDFYGWSRESMRALRLDDLDATMMDSWRTGLPTADQERADIVRRRHRIAGGDARDVEVAASRTVHAGRTAFHLIVHDVTARTRAEAQLRDSDAEFRAVINGMSEGVVIYNSKSVIVAHNPSAERILGLSGEELRGEKVIERDWNAYHEDGTPWPTADHPVHVALRTGVRQPQVVMRIQRRTGDVAWLSVTAQPLMRADEARPYASVAVFTDVTSQRAEEERYRQMQTLDAIGQLAGGIAHDYNNLLTVIRGATGFLRESMVSESDALDDVSTIERATDRAEELTRRLLAVGRRQMLHAESVDLGDLVQDYVPHINAQCTDAIVVELLLSPERVLARLDLAHGRDALKALVDNAVAAMPQGGTLTISTALRLVERAEPDQTMARARVFAMLEVRDTGVGMADDVRERLFEPFFSTKAFGASHGMGLASVHGMMAQSDGFVECDSALGVGTSLRLYFPCATADDRVRTPPRSVPAIATRGVLLVDDDAMLGDLARRMLERLGHTVWLAESGTDAVPLLARLGRTISVLVTDLTMPGMSGLELIEHVQREYPALPIVAISGFSLNASARDELAMRKVAFVPKPFHADALNTAIERAIATHATSVSTA